MRTQALISRQTKEKGVGILRRFQRRASERTEGRKWEYWAEFKGGLKGERENKGMALEHAVNRVFDRVYNKTAATGTGHALTT